MASRTISTRVAIEGESEYRQSVAGIKSSLGALKAELGAVKAEFHDSANSMDALKAKGEALNKLHTEQVARLKAVGDALENAKGVQAEYASKVEAAQARVAAAKAGLEKMASASGTSQKAQAALTAELEKYEKELAEAERYNEAAQRGVSGWKKELNNAKRDLTKLNADIQTNDRRLEEARKSADGCATSIDQYGKKIKQADDGTREANASINTLASALAAAGVAVALREIAEALNACADASIQFESAVTGVFKTVDGTDAQLAAISEGIKKLSTEIPATTTQIAAVAEAAGQLGIATDDVLSFTRVMLDLGESTNLSADEAASALAKFANITGTAAADYERLGSAIVGLGNNFATTEADIVAMATRLASAGTLAGMTESDILALATAMSSVGIEAEAGGTAMAQTLTAIEKAVAKGGDSLEEFARISGVSAKEFSAMWKADAVSAIQSFTAGLGRLDEQGESAVLVLDSLGLSGVRQSNMLKSLALASDTLTGAVSLSSRAWEENTALAEEAGKRYATLESQAAMLENSFTNVKVAIGDALAPALREIAEAGTEGFQWAAEFIEQNPWLVQTITAVTVGLGALVVGVTGVSVVLPIATKALAAFKAVLASTAGVPMLVVSALAALVAGIGMFVSAAKAAEEGLSKATREATSTYQEQKDEIGKTAAETSNMVSALEELAAKEEKTAADKAAILGLVRDLNKAVPDLSLAYDEQTDSLNLTTEAIERMALAQQAAAEVQSTQDALSALYTERQALEEQMADALTKLQDAKEKYAQFDGVEARTRKEQLAVDHAMGTMMAAEGVVERLSAAQKGNEEQIAVLEAEYDGLTKTVETATASVESAADTLTVFTTVLGQVQGGYELLSKAQDEMEKSGSLSISTVTRLVDTYPELTKYLVATADGYELTTGALEDYMAAQRAEYQVALNEAKEAATALIDQNGDETVAIDATTEAIKRKLEALRAEAGAKVSAIAAQAPSSGSMYGQYAWVQAQEGYKEAAAAAKAYGDALSDLTRREEELASVDRAGSMLSRDGAGKSGGSSKSGGKKEKDAAMEALQAWLEDMDHQIYLWGKEGGREEAIAGAYRDMQEAVHKLAGEYRAKGLKDDSEQIQQLQKLWWGYADALEKQNQDAYSRELSALEEALGNEEITTGEYLERRAALQTKYLTEGSAAWEAAEKDRQAKAKQLNKAAYDEARADLDYFHDMGIDSDAQYYARLLELQREYLEENSEEWRRVNVELHNYLEKCRKEELEAVKKAYDEQLKALGDALDDRLAAVKTAYNNQVDAIKSAYSDEVAALKKKFSEEKTVLKEGYDQAKEAAKAAYDARKEAAKTAYEEKKKAIQEELKLEKDRLNAVLEGIDAEIQARRELREDEDLDAKIAAARKRLENARTQRKYARTDEDRAEWDKEIVRLKEALDKAVQDKEDTEFYREKELEKEAVREQIGAAEEKADAALEGLKTEYDAQVKELDAAYKAKTKELEAEYKANVAALEARQEAALAAAKKAYEEDLARAKADYERRVEAAKQDYEDAKSRLEGDRAGAEKGVNDKYDRTENGGGGREYSDIVHAIARENDVSLDIAQDMYEANQRNEGNPDLPHYSDGGYSAGKAVAAAAGAIGAAVAGMAASVGRSVENNVRNSASVVINQASALTEGQVARTVRKVLDEMGR